MLNCFLSEIKITKFEDIFRGIFDEAFTQTITPTAFLLCVGIALLCGVILACVYAFRSRYTRSFLITLALLPSIVCIVIMTVNGNVGTSVAVMGAFSLVRFRSVPGTAKEISVLFLAMATGLVAGVGYLAYAVLISILFGAILIACQLIRFPKKLGTYREKTMRITIPEDLNYSGMFDDILAKYTSYAEITAVKTTNMGSMFKITYDIIEKDVTKEKDFIDELRVRNGNLEILISDRESKNGEL